MEVFTDRTPSIKYGLSRQWNFISPLKVSTGMGIQTPIGTPIPLCLSSLSGSIFWFQLPAELSPGRWQMMAQELCHPRWRLKLSSWLLVSAILAQPWLLQAFGEYISWGEIWLCRPFKFKKKKKYWIILQKSRWNLKAYNQKRPNTKGLKQYDSTYRKCLK